MALADVELVRAAQGGDAASLGILLERHRAPLYALALQILGHGPDAQDAVQDTFLVALRKFDQLREPEAGGRWLRAILRNVCLMRLRKGHRQILFDDLSTRFEKESPESSAEEAIEHLALREWVWTALSELPEDLRVTAMLRYFSSCSSYEEISAILGVPIGTVGTHLNRVKVKLAEALLKTAGLEHDEARKVSESRTHFFAEVFKEGNRDQDYELFASAFSDDLLCCYADGSLARKHEFLAYVKGDLEAGVKLHLTNLLASKAVTVVEGDFENPPDNTFRCHPATSMVFFYRDGRIHLLRKYFAPRTEEG